MNETDPVALGLPHREPFVFIDRVELVVPGESSVCWKSFPPETDFFRGHFPSDPLVPGVILTEALAQTAGIAAGQPGKAFRLSAVKMMKFLAAVRPGEEIRLVASRLGNVGGMWQFEVRATVVDRTVAEGAIILSEAG